MALTIKENYPLKKHNTFGIAVKAAVFAEYDSEEGLAEAAALLREGRLPRPLLHIGSGSNLLFTKDFPGTVLHSCIKTLEVMPEVKGKIPVKAGSGFLWDDFTAVCSERGWYGAENLTGIPGETGAATVQNIGAYGTEVKDIIHSVEAMDLETGERKCFTNPECGYGYRKSIFKLPENKRYIVTRTTFLMSAAPVWNLSYKALAEAFDSRTPESIQEVRQAVKSIRDSKLPDPAVIGNAGSFFTNPIVPKGMAEELKASYPDIPVYGSGDPDTVKLSAGWMIDRAGWKGKSLGHAGVYGKQALVLVNLGGAEGNEIAALADAVRDSVMKMFGVELHPEVNIL